MLRGVVQSQSETRAHDSLFFRACAGFAQNCQKLCESTKKVPKEKMSMLNRALFMCGALCRYHDFGGMSPGAPCSTLPN